ncbi:MAG: hypothetical protein WBK76_00650 [Candidatus Saccharimonadales bacterium]
MGKAKNKSDVKVEDTNPDNSPKGESGDNGNDSTSGLSTAHVEPTTDTVNPKIAAILKAVNKKSGDTFGARVKLGIPAKKKFLTGCFPLDYLTGGLAAGLVVFWGEERSGKSTASARVVSAGQKRGETWAWVDAELNMGQNSTWLEHQGVDVEKLIVIDSGTLENMLDVVVSLAREDLIDGFVIDSVAALQPDGEVQTKKEVAKSLNDDTQGLLQRKMGQFYRSIVGPCAKHNILGILVSQGYCDINNYGMLVPKGGNAMKHFGQCRLRFRKGGKADNIIIKQDKEEVVIGYSVYVEIEKVKQDGMKNLGTSIRIPFLLDSGYSDSLFIIEQAIAAGLIVQNGAWYTFKDQQLGQGYTALVNFNNPQIIEELKHALYPSST